METIEIILDYIALAIGLTGILVIVWGVIEGLIKLVRIKSHRFKNKGKQFAPLEHIRYDIGVHILQGLQLIIVADIIHTLITPSLEELSVLGIIVVIRIALGYFLGREIKEIDRYGNSV
jgi:uncharacterized membrane protein